MFHCIHLDQLHSLPSLKKVEELSHQERRDQLEVEAIKEKLEQGKPFTDEQAQNLIVRQFEMRFEILRVRNLEERGKIMAKLDAARAARMQQLDAKNDAIDAWEESLAAISSSFENSKEAQQTKLSQLRQKLINSRAKRNVEAKKAAQEVLDETKLKVAPFSEGCLHTKTTHVSRLFFL